MGNAKIAETRPQFPYVYCEVEKDLEYTLKQRWKKKKCWISNRTTAA